MDDKFRNHCFGIEIEHTGITRDSVSDILGREFCKTTKEIFLPNRGYYNYRITDKNDRKWNVKLDSSIAAERYENGRIVPASSFYMVELISPILQYDRDIDTLLWIINRLRNAGALANKKCGIHIHLDGRQYTAHDVKNLCNIVASRTELFSKSLEIVKARRMKYCQDLDLNFIRSINAEPHVSLESIEEAWYTNPAYNQRLTRNQHYHPSRYRFLNLHSFFHGHRTLELRCFNGSLDPETIRAYIAFALGLNYLAQTTQYTWYRPVELDNPRYTMVHFLQRIGLKGPEFAKAREILSNHLPGDPNWRTTRRT